MKVFDLYHPIRDQICSGDLIEWHTIKSPVASLIRLFTGQDFNHSSFVLVLPEEYRVGYRDKVIVIEAVAGGIKSSYLSNVIADHRGYVTWYKLKDTMVTPEDRLKMARWAVHEELAHKGYDYWALPKQLISKVNAEASKYFCSEFYQIALEEIGLIGKGKKAIRPGEFEELDLHEPGIVIGNWN